MQHATDLLEKSVIVGKGALARPAKHGFETGASPRSICLMRYRTRTPSSHHTFGRTMPAMTDPGSDKSADPQPGEALQMRILDLLRSAADPHRNGLIQDDAAAALKWIEERNEEMCRQMRWRTYFVDVRNGFLVLRQGARQTTRPSPNGWPASAALVLRPRRVMDGSRFLEQCRS